MDLSSRLLDMLEAVNQAPNERAAATALLLPLIAQFDMDQAVLCEIIEGAAHPIFAIDRSRRVLNFAEDKLLLSRTLMLQAIRTMEPVTHVNRDAELAPSQSINDLSIRCLVCIPISRAPARVVLLASQRNPLRIIDSGDLTQIKTATRAAILAFQQRHSLQGLQARNAQLQEVLEDRRQGLVYASKSMESVVNEAAKLSPYNINLFLCGESGVGKEELAREIHRISGRGGRFVAVNCANLTETLLESELFGHMKGAFTGAFQNKKGLLEEADKGTFFLDEIGDLPMALQAKLLRVIQERQFRPIGSSKDVAVDLRFLSASHKNLVDLVQQKSFREDLYYRIQESTLVIPPLRNRREDMEVLAHHFVQMFSSEFQLPARHLSAGALERIMCHSWPGNIRELKNVCRMAVILSSSTEVLAEHIRLPVALSAVELPSIEEPKVAPPVVAPAPEPEISGKIPDLFAANLELSGNLKGIIQEFELSLVSKLLDEQGATQLSVADRLGISVRTLQRMINRPSVERIHTQ